MDIINFSALIRPELVWLIALAAIWDLSWKGVALWKSAGRRQMAWFVVLLITNTIGLLPIIYIYFFSRAKKKGAVKIKARKKFKK
jgi:hypothetical protein